MEDSGGTVKGPDGPESKKKRRRWSNVAIIAVGIAGMLITIALIVPAALSPNHQILQAGDFLQYDFSGSYNNSSFSSRQGTNITVTDASESGVSYFATGEGHYLISDLGHDFKFFYGAPSGGQIIGTEQISTPFGVKCVTTVYWFYSGNDEVILIEVGVDSYLVYRWTVSSMTGLYHYTYQLTATNNTMIHSADRTMRTANIEVLNTPAPKACTSHSFGYVQPGMGSGYVYGSVRIAQGQQLHYIIGGNATMYVMDLNDLRNIETNGQFQFREDLSRMAGDPGETNVSVDPGIYWFLVVCKGSDEAIDYFGYPTSAYFVPYFGFRGQDF